MHHGAVDLPNVKPDSSLPLRELHAGDLIEIKEVWTNHEAKRIRGRLATGGWISISNTETGYAWCVAGPYKAQQEAIAKAARKELKVTGFVAVGG